MENKVLVTGATGATGSSAIKNLLELGVPIRAMVHKIDNRSEELKNKGVEIVQGDLNDFEAVNRAMQGISAAYFVFPIEIPGIIEATAFFIEAALENNVKHIVNLTQRTAKRNAKSHAAQNHWIAERILDRSTVPVTHLRPTLFAEWLSYIASDIRENDRIVLPFGNGRFAPITAEDQGRVIAKVLSDPESHTGKNYDLLGPVELDVFEIADSLSEVVGRKITYIPIDIEPFQEILGGSMGFSPWAVQHVGAIAQDARDGVVSGTNNTVEELTGTKPLTITQYITKNKHLFIK
ncbi:NmrA family NAD(P)-binding protein [Flavobacterium sp. LC2016-01]|uniref:NmrA family NAD(P)-binding protein n=1 Tax=Flavobacterium sp. LC2016-01 TaxID=2675876 RepID=UPI0012BB1CD3|nr:NmrA family NAD(P)-binding protein [Flavobacterium sp. LC2016-01]MTH15854.1 NAD(P)H-binding protein [Flavobacterium sp. LC2016-01]